MLYLMDVPGHTFEISPKGWAVVLLKLIRIVSIGSGQPTTVRWLC